MIEWKTFGTAEWAVLSAGALRVRLFVADTGWWTVKMTSDLPGILGGFFEMQGHAIAREDSKNEAADAARLMLGELAAALAELKAKVEEGR